MRKHCVFIFLLILFLFCFSPSIYASEILFFFEKGCPECGKINDFLQKRIKPNYSVVIREYEIHNPDNANLLMDLARIYKADAILEKGTPAVFIGDKAFQGSSRVIQRRIEEAVRLAARFETESPLNRLKREGREERFKRHITLPAVLGAAAVDSINPCACAVLVLLLGTILLASKRKRSVVLGAGFAFSAACFISYFLMGIGLFSAVQVIGIQHYIYIAVAVLAILLGLWNIKESFGRGNRFKIEVPKSWQPVLKRITSNISSVPGAFGMGLVISLFLLPCTSGPYVVIIGMLSDIVTRMQAVWLLLLYNAIFILPFVVITLAVGLGFATTARIEKWRQERLSKIHFITGIVMFALGMTISVFLILGTI